MLSDENGKTAELYAFWIVDGMVKRKANMVVRNFSIKVHI